jgi:hypothetical protein
MTTSFHFHVAVQVLFQTFSCFVKNAIVVSRIAAFAKYTTGGLESIAVMAKLPASRQLFLGNVLEQQRKEPGVKTKRPIQAVVAIFTKFYKSIKSHTNEYFICNRFEYGRDDCISITKRK